MKTETKGLLRFATTGSVDDGKSTLIGRLLYESQGIYEDQLLSVSKASQRRGHEEVDLSLLLDGLSVEREQGITIDVAYRFFSSPKRKFIIADCPGHEQYTRNMVTGASNVDLAIILIDARKGVQTQSKRHGFLLSLLQVPHLVVAVNKMDLVDYSEEAYQKVVDEYTAFSKKLNIHDIRYIPMSALKGDNITRPSEAMPWYRGATLLHHLENVEAYTHENRVDFRFPVQYVSRPNQDFRGFAGQIASGSIRKGEEVSLLPSGKTTRVKSIETFDGALEKAEAGDSVVLQLEDELDLSRGDMIVRKNNLPQKAREIDTFLCWMGDTPLKTQGYYLLKHATKTVKAYVRRINYKTNVNTLHREKDTVFNLNAIGRVELTCSEPLFFDPYRLNRRQGSFILIDPNNYQTVAAGMIKGQVKKLEDMGEEKPAKAYQSSNIVREALPVSRVEWERRNGHQGAILWFTGLSGAGKSTLAGHVSRTLFEAGKRTMYLDGDNMRFGLCGDLGFTSKDRSENIRRVAETAKLFFSQGNLVLCSFISPFVQDREFVRSLVPEGHFLEIHVDCPLEVCQDRDPKGLYKKVERGEIFNFTGVDSPYEAPPNPDILLRTDQISLEKCQEQIMNLLKNRGLI